MKLLNFKDFLNKNKLKRSIMNESDLHRVNSYPMHLPDLKLYSVKGFINIDNGSQSGIHCTAFYIRITNLLL